MPSETSWVNLNFLKTVFGAGSLFIGRIREGEIYFLKEELRLVMKVIDKAEIARHRGVIKAIYGEDGNLNKDVSGGVRTCWTSIVHEVRCVTRSEVLKFRLHPIKAGNGRTRGSGSTIGMKAVSSKSCSHIMRKISSWWNIDYSDVNSSERMAIWLVSTSNSIQSKLKGFFDGCILWFCGMYM
ncbi:hypothetical protein Tco_0285454 [Tanacetum coccineum]